jgi:PAS domain S-box-containing protein
VNTLSIRDRPINQKLMIIITVTTTVALLLSGCGIVAFNLILFRADLERDLNTLAGIIADNSTAALAFNDPIAAKEMLGALRARNHLVTACIIRADGTELAQYSRQGATDSCPSPERQDELRFKRADVTISHAIMLSDRRIGTLVLLYDLDEVAERLKVYGLTVLIFVLISSLVAFLISSRLLTLITRPISQLVLATTAVAETNDYSVRAQKLSKDELGVLVDRFNDMLGGIQSRDKNLRHALRDREEALREAEAARERFRFLAESMPQKIFTATPSGDVDYFNRQWMEFTGLTFNDIKGWGWTRFIHPDCLEDNLLSWRRSVETGEPFRFEHRVRRADGAYRWHLTRALAMRDADGKISMWIASNTDIHEQKEREEELRRANDDLQQFAFSASHDLQEPIRNVAIYSEIVADQYKDRLDDEGQQFLGFLTEGGRRLATLINDLLAYTRAGVALGEVTNVDSEVVLQHTLSNLTEAIRENQAKVTHDSLPEVLMGEAHLQQIFQNLITNALKYRTEQPPLIHISATDLGSAWRISVEDNGIGIQSQYKEKIFGVFKRLHRDEKYPGTGIGLAICQRVVERYGGRIWVESEPGKGSTFFFTIPRSNSRLHVSSGESSVG